MESEPPPPEGERIRLKPQLAPEPEPEVTETPVEPAAALEAEALPLPPAPEEGKIKLKIKLPGAAAQEILNPPVDAAPPVEEAVAEPPVLPPFPVVAPPPEEEELETPPPIPAVSAKSPPPPVSDGSRPNVFKRPRVPAALLAAERRKRMWKYALIAVGGVILAGAVIFGAFLKFTEPPPPIHVPMRALPPPDATVQTPVPNKVVTKPKIEPVVPSEAGSGTRVDSTATVELTPGVMATTESVKAVSNASSAFRTFVASARINGVYQGTPSRAFINGRLIRTGEMIDSTMEIYFDSVDLASRSIVFKDSTGATVSRRY